MTLPILKYGDPVLRKKGTRIEHITPAISTLIEDMLETMNAAKGIGLAAQQVGHPIQLAVVDVRGATDRPSTLFLDDQPSDVSTFMPLVLLNPELKPVGEPVIGPEGCLSFPEMYADISRPDMIEVTALDRRGEPLECKCGGLLSRVIQHEVDHLHGILFIDRMSREEKSQLKPELDVLQETTKQDLAKQRKVQSFA